MNEIFQERCKFIFENDITTQDGDIWHKDKNNKWILGVLHATYKEDVGLICKKNRYIRMNVLNYYLLNIELDDITKTHIINNTCPISMNTANNPLKGWNVVRKFNKQELCLCGHIIMECYEAEQNGFRIRIGVECYNHFIDANNNLMINMKEVVIFKNQEQYLNDINMKKWNDILKFCKCGNRKVMTHDLCNSCMKQNEMIDKNTKQSIIKVVKQQHKTKSKQLEQERILKISNIKKIQHLLQVKKENRIVLQQNKIKAEQAKKEQAKKENAERIKYNIERQKEILEEEKRTHQFLMNSWNDKLEKARVYMRFPLSIKKVNE
jgi:hypothetical protein